MEVSNKTSTRESGRFRSLELHRPLSSAIRVNESFVFLALTVNNYSFQKKKIWIIVIRDFNK
jgi:hypothetical protein